MTDDESGLAEALEGVSRLYTQSLQEHGLAPKAVGWRDEATHRLRFERLAQLIDLRPGGPRFSVNDLGCGYAAMFSYLDALPGGRLAGYYGYDISDEMLAAARRAVTDSRAVFIKSESPTHEADYSFVSGTFNVKLESSNEVWGDYVRETLLALAAKSRRGMAFNLLSTYVDWKQDHLFYADPLAFFDFCKRNISRYVSLLHDYPLFEWTILVRKEPYIPL